MPLGRKQYSNRGNAAAPRGAEVLPFRRPGAHAPRTTTDAAVRVPDAPLPEQAGAPSPEDAAKVLASLAVLARARLYTLSVDTNLTLAAVAEGVALLVGRGHAALEQRPDGDDARRWVRLTPAGAAAHRDSGSDVTDPAIIVPGAAT